MKNRHTQFAEQLLSVRPSTRSLVTSILMDAWPNHGAVVDFGIATQKHYEALYFPIREAEIMPVALDDALGDGHKLTALAHAAASSPHKDVQFHTSWDLVLGRDRSRTIGLHDLRNGKTQARASDREMVHAHDRGDLER